MSLHSSRASLSEQLDDSRCARRLRIAANGEESEAGGISRTKRDRMSPIGKAVSLTFAKATNRSLAYGGSSQHADDLAGRTAVV